jgi:hypothetical protein
MRCCFLSAATLAAVVFAAGCKPKGEIQVYQAPKDAQSGPADTASSEARPAADSASARPPWIVPDGWAEKPATGGMRIASYGVTTADGRSVDISVVPLGGQAGSLLDNVNRWRNQLQLAPLADSDLATERQLTKIGDLDGELYEMVSQQPVLDGKFKARTLAAILSLGGTTVFFKATGEDALVAENKPKFLAWLKSVQTGPAAPPETAAKPSADMRGPVPQPPATGLPQWNLPAGWKSVPASTMRLASFAVDGGNGQTGDVSVVALGPASGGVLANVNRWRNQFGLGPLDETGLAPATSTLDTPAGDHAVIVELNGEGPMAGKRMLAAIVARPDRTWFYKLTGEAALVAAQKDGFVSFVKSVKYP